MKSRTFIIAVILASVLTMATVFAATTFTQNLTWTYQTEGFTVTSSSADNLGTVVGSSIKTITYTVTNTGSIPIDVYASTTGTGFSASWADDNQNVPVSGSATFVLTLTITGSGSCAVHLDKNV